jgi:SAM-dependent methyltransferase
MTQQIATGFKERKDWIGIRWAAEDDMQYGRETHLLDYACGTGSVTKAIGSWVTHVRGIDVSENMVKIFNDTARASGLGEERVKAVVGDLIAEEPSKGFESEEWKDFDIAAIGLGFHHFEEPLRAVQRLTERLKPGTGVLLIIDFLPFDKDEPGAQQAASHTIKHGGFARQNMEMLFKAAKLENFSFSIMEEEVEMIKDGKSTKRRVFFARGRREPTTWGKISNWVWNIQSTASDQFSITPRDEVGSKLGFTGGRDRSDL